MKQTERRQTLEQPAEVL